MVDFTFSCNPWGGASFIVTTGFAAWEGLSWQEFHNLASVQMQLYEVLFKQSIREALLGAGIAEPEAAGLVNTNHVPVVLTRPPATTTQDSYASVRVTPERPTGEGYRLPRPTFRTVRQQIAIVTCKCSLSFSVRSSSIAHSRAAQSRKTVRCSVSSHG
jgi:hypothetical protein